MRPGLPPSPHPFELVCPRCRRLDADGRLLVSSLVTDAGVAARAGALDGAATIDCATGCGARYPVIDGVPIIFGSPDAVDLDDLLTAPAVTLAAALSGQTSDSSLGRTAARVGRWAWAAMRDWMNADARGSFADSEIHPVAVMRWLAEVGAAPPPGHVLGVLGAGAGREAWESPGETLLVEAHLPLLLLTQRLLRDGRAEVVLPRDATRWEVATIDAPASPRARVGLVCGDVLDPPLRARCLGGIVAANLIDSVSDPVLAVRQMAALLEPLGHVVITSPFTWRAEVTPKAQWLESRVSEAGVGPDVVLRALASEVGLVPIAERELRWALRATAREAALYESLGIIFRKA